MTQDQKFQSGQVLLITLLVLSVATTIALSIIGRTTLETQSTSQLEESMRAFNAAEAGIEVALKNSVESSITNYIPGVNYNATIADIGNATGVYQLPAKTEKGSTETIWLANHVNGVLDEDTQAYTSDIDVCISSETPVEPALLVSVYYVDTGIYKVKSGAYDPAPASRSTPNQFSSIEGTLGGCGNSGMYVKTGLITALGIDPAAVVLLTLRIRPVYSDATIGVNAGTSLLPLQGNKIESTGTAPSSGIARRIIVNQEFQSASTAFDGGIYSQGTFGH